MPSPFVILTGASGVGKTSIALNIEKSYPEIAVYRGDSIGLPSEELMASYGPANGPGGASQRGFALYWIGVIAPTLLTGRPVLLEGQTRIAFLQEALAQQGISHARVILVECDDETREARLIHDRQQPELSNDNMKGWSRYLHQEAVEAGYEILDTSATPLSESVARIVSYLK
jgi:chloramphenicol 3-O-phosphotransferase